MPNLRSGPASIILALLTVGLLCACEPVETGRSADRRAAALHSTGGKVGKIQAVTFDARRPPADSVLHALRELGVTHLALVSFGFQETANDPDLRYNPNPRWYSESADGARTIARDARALGMGIVLKPQIWLRGGAWTADIDFDSEREWLRWEEDYRAYLMHTARLAHEIGADLLVVGTELGNPVRERSTFWRELIGAIRGVYGGPITYAANWHDDYLDVPFWDALDFIGVQAYFPISNADDPDLDALKEGWRAHAAELEALSRREQRPVLFTEIGYRSVSYAAEEPWRWPSRDEEARPDYRLQADLYRAFFESVWDRPWFAGAIVWKYYPEAADRGRELDFTPQGKPAEAVLRRWFTRSTDVP